MTDDTFRRLVATPRTASRAGTIPWPPLAQLYSHLHGQSDERRLEVACAAVRFIGLLGEWFEESCVRCADWDNTNEAFHPTHRFTEAHKREQESDGRHIAANHKFGVSEAGPVVIPVRLRRGDPLRHLFMARRADSWWWTRSPKAGRRESTTIPAHEIRGGSSTLDHKRPAMPSSLVEKDG